VSADILRESLLRQNGHLKRHLSDLARKVGGSYENCHSLVTKV
jgi:hypothetical protein